MKKTNLIIIFIVIILLAVGLYVIFGLHDCTKLDEEECKMDKRCLSVLVPCTDPTCTSDAIFKECKDKGESASTLSNTQTANTNTSSVGQPVNTNSINTNTANVNNSRLDEDEEAIIERMENTINPHFTGINNQGKEYLQYLFVDRRYTQNEEYFTTIRFNADEYSNNLQEKKVIQKKMGEVLKDLFTTEDKLEIVQFEAYFSLEINAKPAYSIEINKSQADTVDWDENEETLFYETLPETWTLKISGYTN